jgi:hypothetical protein
MVEWPNGCRVTDDPLVVLPVGSHFLARLHARRLAGHLRSAYQPLAMLTCVYAGRLHLPCGTSRDGPHRLEHLLHPRSTTAGSLPLSPAPASLSSRPTLNTRTTVERDEVLPASSNRSGRTSALTTGSSSSKAEVVSVRRATRPSTPSSTSDTVEYQRHRRERHEDRRRRLAPERVHRECRDPTGEDCASQGHAVRRPHSDLAVTRQRASKRGGKAGSAGDTGQPAGRVEAGGRREDTEERE